MNVRINASGIKDKTFTEDLINRVNEIEKKAEAMEAAVRSQIV
jgi:formiminotetrahydrofolate cyclodeaminase